jgi:glycosyltransferase involved in cell wall biosynthesis
MTKLLIWTNMPNHYQRGLFDAMRAAGVDLRVAYYESVTDDRRAMGWSATPDLPEGEAFVDAKLDSLAAFPDWRERTHFVAGYGTRFLRALARRLSRDRVRWVHWSERSHDGLRWAAGYPLKRAYAELVNRRALGAFGIGRRAMEDFHRWGIRREKLANLPYSPAGIAREGPSDETCSAFKRDGKAFLFLGGLNHRKGIDLLLTAFARATKDQPAPPTSTRWSLLLVGDDRSRGAYERQARELGISERVLFRGAMPPSDLATALRAAEVLVLPSRFDGWGVTLNEGASAGLALIGSDACGASDDLVSPGENGFVVAAGNVDSLSRAMRAYVVDVELAARHGAASRTIFEQHTPARAAERMIEALRSWQAVASSEEF